ncbi:MAG: N-acetyltransferase family protein [Gammaproteobacteria bacterium]|nr:N-acetyltransferase family protein [Gammaproteobacteria bacterium]
MSTALLIRPALETDAAALLEIYRHYVENTAISFEMQVPGVEEFKARIAKVIVDKSWLIAETNGVCTGYAYATSLRQRAAYRWSVETSAYVHIDYQRRGIGRALYKALLADLEQKNFCNAYAAITLPNDASVGLHLDFGFEPIGVFKSVGRKFGAWHDVGWYYRKLRSEPPE